MGGGALVMNQRERCRLVIRAKVRGKTMTGRKASKPYQKTKPHELMRKYVPAADHPWRRFSIKAKPHARALPV